MKKIHDFCADNTFVIALITIFVVIFSYVFNFHAHNFSENSGDWGTFGDFFGGTLNPLLSFLALIILLRTFAMQKEELNVQRQELKETKEILKIQTKTQVKQQFESTFFALLNVHNQVLKDSDTNLVDLGKVLFRRAEFSEMRDDEENNESCKESNFIKLCVAKKRMEERPYLWGQYFFTLYELLKFVAVNSPDSKIDINFDAENLENSEVGLNEKTYSDIVRASIPNDVLYLLAVVCYCEHDANDIYRKYKLLIERYALFKHIEFGLSKNKTDFAILEDILDYYDKKAFDKDKV